MARIWTFKRQLCQQLALSSFVSALLRISGRTPRKISFAKNTGKVFMLDFYPNFDSNGFSRIQRNRCHFVSREICTPSSRRLAPKVTLWPPWPRLPACATPGRNVRMHLNDVLRDCVDHFDVQARQQQQAQQQNVDANDAAAKTSAAAAAFFSEPDASTVNEMAKANVEEAMKRLPIIAPIPTREVLNR